MTAKPKVCAECRKRPADHDGEICEACATANAIEAGGDDWRWK